MSSPKPETKRDYSETLFLPQTDFPMRAGLPQREPEILKRWEEGDLYGRLRAAAKGRDKFIAPHAVCKTGTERARPYPARA